MRVPLLIVIPAALLVAAIVWWSGTAGMDFLTPPSGEELTAIRQRVEASMPQPDRPRDAISVPSAPLASPVPVRRPPQAPAKPVADPADLQSPLVLPAYADLGPKGAAYLAAVAAALESGGEFQRALLAWERVLDTAEATPEELAAAVSATRRLRPGLPPWNDDPEAVIRVVLHAGTASSQAAELEPAMLEVAQMLADASSGILQLSHKVTAGQRNVGAAAPAPVAIRLAGAGDAAPSTEVLSFRVGDPDDLVAQLAGSVFLLVRNYVERSGKFTTPPPLAAGESAAEAMEFRISRWVWHDLGHALNPGAADDD
jgi:hypothetical protein